MLTLNAIIAGAFHGYELQKGTIEVYFAINNLRLGVITMVAKFDKNRAVPGTSRLLADARFTPLGTTDVIEGTVSSGTYDFTPAPPYLAPNGEGLLAVKADAPAWLRDVYGLPLLAASRQQRQEKARTDAEQAEKYRQAHLAQQAYDAAHPGAAAQKAAAERAAAPTYVRPNAPAPTYQPTQHEVTCGVCGGSGWVSGRNYGQRDQCGGRGKVTTRY